MAALFGEGGGGEEVSDNCCRDSQLWLWWWVGAAVAFEDAVEAEVVFACGTLSEAGIWSSEVQFEGLSNGSKSCLDCLDADSSLAGISAASDPRCKGFQGGEGFVRAVVWELGV